MTTQPLDIEKAQAFGGAVVGMLNATSAILLISVGHRVGLFDQLATMPPATSQDIASATGLNERYVREWLSGMTVARVVEHDPTAGTFWLPAEHAASLTRAAGPNNLASFAEFMPLLGQVENGIVDAFRRGGGVPYSEYPRFQELMKASSAQVFDATLIDVTLPLVPTLVERLTAGIDVADVGCGSGHAINLMAQRYPNSRFTGYDFSEAGVAEGRSEATALGLSNATFEVKDVAELTGPPRFDFITSFDSIHDQAQPRRVLKGIHDALRPGGTYLCVDINASSQLHENLGHPLGTFLYTVSTLHCMTVSLALNGEGLGTCWGEQVAGELMAEAGFGELEVRHVEGDILNNYYIATK